MLAKHQPSLPRRLRESDCGCRHRVTASTLTGSPGQRAQEAIFREQPQLLKALLTLVQPPLPTAPTPPVKPGRPARALIARIITVVLARGDQKSLYDVAQSLLRGVNGTEGKGALEREKEWRIACTYILGEVYAAFGSQVREAPTRRCFCSSQVLLHRAQIMSLYNDIVTATIRIARTTSLVSSR